MQNKTCCFFGHREITETEGLRHQVYLLTEKLILQNGVDTFIFGSKSRFNSLCYEQVSKLKRKYPFIKRIYARAEFLQIDETYKKYLLEHYEDTYCPPKVMGAGKAAYIERNRDMINKSRFCIVYFEENYAPKKRKSGTKAALEYAIRQNKKIFLLPNKETTLYTPT